MNKYQRKELRKSMEQLEQIKDNISLILSEEQDKYSNMPENLQMSDKAENIQEAISNLEDAESSLEDVLSALVNIIYI